MEYLIDGNNVLGYMGRDRSSDNVTYFLSLISQLKPAHMYTVVFDGSPPPNFYNNSASHVNVVWQDKSRDVDADDTIERYAKRYGSRTQTIVVTADRMLHARVVDYAREVIHPNDFISKLLPDYTEEYVPFSKTDEYEGVDEEGITQELRDLWTRKK